VVLKADGAGLATAVAAGASGAETGAELCARAAAGRAKAVAASCKLRPTKASHPPRFEPISFSLPPPFDRANRVSAIAAPVPVFLWLFDNRGDGPAMQSVHFSVCKLGACGIGTGDGAAFLAAAL